ncbi:MAG: GDP-mannose 4,6-dehydratase [Chloroflexota bacterium]|nr:GDP-mannose 4,6-dehydratase [Chloroflexota bacterium]MDE2907683.1 GDP-mannose 4,6-dehydratase [Chloroflexota bacterium]
MRALITGGAGFIGSHLAGRLLDCGYQVTVIDDLSTGQLRNIKCMMSNANFSYAVEDIRNIHVIDRLVSECDIIFHLAAAVGVRNIIDRPINTIEVNIGGTEMILRTASRYRRRVLIASTSEVYGKGVDFPFREDDDTLSGPTRRSRWSYAASKAIDEFLSFAYHEEVGLPVTLFRLFNTVGPRQLGQYGMVVPRFVRWALTNEPIQVYGDGRQQRCFANVFDVVRAIQGLAECDATIGELYNIGSAEEISIMGLAERIRDRADSASEIKLIPYDQAYQQSGFEDFRRRVPSISKIQSAIGWGPSTPLDLTIDQIIAYYQAEMLQD